MQWNFITDQFNTKAISLLISNTFEWVILDKNVPLENKKNHSFVEHFELPIILKMKKMVVFIVYTREHC